MAEPLFHPLFHSLFRTSKAMAPFAALLLAALPLSALPPGFSRTAWVTGIPTAAVMGFSPDGRLFIGGDNGAIRIVKNGKLLAAPFATVKTKTRGGSLSGIAFDPAFAANGFVYVLYTFATAAGGQDDRISRLAADKANPDIAVAGSETILLEGLGGGGHFSGALHFGNDRMLYAATPTSAAAGGNAPQTTDNLHGKVLRINPAGYPAIIPADNPFVGKAGARGEIWALGFREPFSGAADTVKGVFVINDVGDGKVEEVDKIEKGANYGYPTCEGACGKAGLTDPWAFWNHDGMACIAGGTFYYGANFPAEYRGAYFASDEQEKVIKRLGPDGKFAAWDNLTGNVVDLDVGPDGALYYLGYSEHTIFRVANTQATALAGTPAGAARAAFPGKPDPLPALVLANGSRGQTAASVIYFGYPRAPADGGRNPGQAGQ